VMTCVRVRVGGNCGAGKQISGCGQVSTRTERGSKVSYVVVTVVVVGNYRLFSFFSLSFPFGFSMVVRKMANGRGVKARDFFIPFSPHIFSEDGCCSGESMSYGIS